MREKPFVRRSLIYQAIKEMDCHSKEMPRTTMFGATDRKSYTVRTRLVFMDQERISFTEINPWTKNADEIIKEIEERAKYDFANQLFDDGYLSKI